MKTQLWGQQDPAPWADHWVCVRPVGPGNSMGRSCCHSPSARNAAQRGLSPPGNQPGRGGAVPSARWTADANAARQHPAAALGAPAPGTPLTPPQPPDSQRL